MWCGSKSQTFEFYDLAGRGNKRVLLISSNGAVVFNLFCLPWDSLNYIPNEQWYLYIKLFENDIK